MNYDLASVDYILETTRSVRKRLDMSRPVPTDLVMEALEVALQAPTGSNNQGWRWLIVTDKTKIAQVGEHYRKSFMAYAGDAKRPESEDPRVQQQWRVTSSARYLADHMHEVPMLVFACIKGRLAAGEDGAGLFGSSIPAAWSLMLALRARKVGSAWTTLHLRYEKECNAILGIPDDITTSVMLPVAYFSGETFKKATRIPAAALTYFDTWGQKGEGV